MPDRRNQHNPAKYHAYGSLSYPPQLQMAHQAQRRTAPNQTQQTQLATSSQSQTQTQAPAAILRLRGGHNATGRSVQWSEDVIDNEGLGRKTSKVCCIYHRPKGVDESSSESSSDSSSDSSSESNGGASSSAPRKQRAGAGGKGKGKKTGGKDKKHHHDCDKHGHSHDQGGARRPEEGEGSRRRRTSPNAYEKIPKYKPKETDRGGLGGQGKAGG